MTKFLTDNGWSYRLGRTILQGIISILIENVAYIAGVIPMPAELRPVVIALIMAVLSPCMAMLGEYIKKSNEANDAEV